MKSVIACFLAGCFICVYADEPNESLFKEDHDYVEQENSEPFPYSYQEKELCSKKPYDISLQADYIYWLTYEDGLEYALDKGVGIQSFGVFSFARAGNTLKVPAKANSGLKVALSYIIPEQKWDVVTRYTWITNTAKDEKQLADVIEENYIGSASELMSPIWITQIDDTPAGITRTSASWNVKYNMFDLEFGRTFVPEDHILLRPFIGFKGGWIDQTLTLFYGRNFSSTVLLRTDIKNTNDFGGGGLRLGLTPTWQIHPKWSLVGMSSFSLLYGQFTIFQSQIFNDPENASISGTFVYLTDKVVSLKQVLELSFGAKWASNCYREHINFEVYLGWDMQIWLGQNQMMRWAASRNNEDDPIYQGTMFHQKGDLFFQGLDFRIKCNF